jgi:hypothetical protein
LLRGRVLGAPWKDDLPAALALDLELVLPGHFLVGRAGRRVFGRSREAPFHLLPEKEVIEVHGESPRWGAHARYGCRS